MNNYKDLHLLPSQVHLSKIYRWLTYYFSHIELFIQSYYNKCNNIVSSFLNKQMSYIATFDKNQYNVAFIHVLKELQKKLSKLQTLKKKKYQEIVAMC